METPKVVFWGVPEELMNEPFAQDSTWKNSLEQIPFDLIDNADVIVVHSSVGVDQVNDLLHASKLSESHPSIILIEGKEAIPPGLFYEGGGTRVLFEQDITRDEIGRALVQIDRIRKLQEENAKLVAKLTEANQLLEEKNKRLDEFSATVAHDIRGPLGGVVMKLEYLQERYSSQLDERFTTLMSRALGSTQRLTDVVQAMYEFAKLGGEAPNMGNVNLGTLIEEVISDLPVPPELKLEFKIGNIPDVWGNPQLLRRVFNNLFTNAIRYSDKPIIQIEIGSRSVIQRALSEFVEIVVSDNGPGIPKDEQAAIFSFFTRGSNASVKSDGLGIGLAVVKRIIELHYGDVRVESTIGVGTTFVCSLPLKQIEF